MSEGSQKPGLPGQGLYASLTIDDVAAGDGSRVRRLLEWIDGLDLRATFFVIPFSVPNQAPLFEDKELVKALREARDAGHEFFCHGYEHGLFECGLPDLMAVHDEEMRGKIARTLSREEFQLRHQHTRGNIGPRLHRARKILDETFGPEPREGFRSGYHTFCREMYFALETCGFKWSSSRTAVPGAWTARVTPAADDFPGWIGVLPYWVGEILELPHMADYGAHVQPGDEADWVALARRHLAWCDEQRGPFIACATQAGLAGAGHPESWRDLGRKVYSEIVALARDEFGAEWVRLSEIAAHAFATPHYWPQKDEYRR